MAAFAPYGRVFRGSLAEKIAIYPHLAIFADFEEIAVALLLTSLKIGGFAGWKLLTPGFVEFRSNPERRVKYVVTRLGSAECNR